jgi:hypothetical protein
MGHLPQFGDGRIETAISFKQRSLPGSSARHLEPIHQVIQWLLHDGTWRSLWSNGSMS